LISGTTSSKKEKKVSGGQKNKPPKNHHGKRKVLVFCNRSRCLERPLEIVSGGGGKGLGESGQVGFRKRYDYGGLPEMAKSGGSTCSTGAMGKHAKTELGALSRPYISGDPGSRFLLNSGHKWGFGGMQVRTVGVTGMGEAPRGNKWGAKTSRRFVKRHQQRHPRVVNSTHENGHQCERRATQEKRFNNSKTTPSGSWGVEKPKGDYRPFKVQ